MRIFIFIIGLLILVWGGIQIGLGFGGETSAALAVQMRRTGGERDDAAPNRYTYSISYEFVTREGRRMSGHSQAVGNAYAAKPLKRICYFAAAPYLNAPADQCGFSAYSITLTVVGAVIMWATARRRSDRPARGSARAQGGAKQRPPREATADAGPPPLGLTGAEAEAWVARYRGNARRYAWIFFAVVVVGIGSLVRWELGEFSREWAMATGFAGLVTWILAWYTRRRAESAWTGTVVDKSVTERRRHRDSHETFLSYMAVFETPRGKRVRLRLTPALFDFYEEGRSYRKVAGLDYPVPLERGDQTGICPVCGKSYADATTHCTGCRAPVLDFSHRATADPAPATAR